MIMKNALLILNLTTAALVSGCAFGQTPALPDQLGPHQWTANVKVIGEDGNPVSRADVAISYTLPPPPGRNLEEGPDWSQVKGLTDTNGMFTASHFDSSEGLGIVLEKAGYYTTHIGYQFYFDDKRRNPTFISVIKKIRKPIPMYAKFITSIKFPALNKPVGYDLMVGDWAAPYGKGVSTDFLFTENHTNAKSGYSFTVSFPNNGDGIQEFDMPAWLQNAPMGQSDFRSSHEAPVDGYQSKFAQIKGPDLNRNYYFRVRTRLDEKGNVTNACYGKIYGDFMQFRYYLNPTPNDRNIEFDPKQNLLGGLQTFEQVSAP